MPYHFLQTFNNLPPINLGPGERLVVEERNTLFGRRTTYRVKRDGNGGGNFWLVLLLIGIAVGFYFFGC